MRITSPRVRQQGHGDSLFLIWARRQESELFGLTEELQTRPDLTMGSKIFIAKR
jgi:hypothetical protein